MAKRVFHVLTWSEMKRLESALDKVWYQGKYIRSRSVQGRSALALRNMEDFLTDLTYEVRRIRRDRGVKVYKQWEEVL